MFNMLALMAADGTEEEGERRALCAQTEAKSSNGEN
jgi:hypothetical protein